MNQRFASAGRQADDHYPHHRTESSRQPCSHGHGDTAVIDRRPYLTCREVILAGMRRAAGVRRDTGRKAKDAAELSWDSEGGAIEQGK